MSACALSVRSSKRNSSAWLGKPRAHAHAKSTRSRLRGTPAISRALLAGTPLAGDEHAVELLKDLRHGGLYQRMDEVGRQRLAAVMVRTLTALAEACRRAQVLSSACCRYFAPWAGAAPISRC